jgi:uncharacterized protein with HEPN domain
VKDTPTRELFITSRKTHDAVLRNFSIIGEAANNLDDDFIEKYSHVAWDTIIEDLPAFKVQIEILLKEEIKNS